MLYFGTLACKHFDIKDPETLEIDVRARHEDFRGRQILLIRTIVNDPYYMELTQDLVYLVAFANIKGDRILMGYSEKFNVLVVSDWPESKGETHDLYEKKVHRGNHSWDPGKGDHSACILDSPSGKWVCDCCGSSFFSIKRE